ncbi:flagellar biosynthetic protein FliO [Luteimonas sp. BDR2-5]|uniref:flagellar biosynthetic protein FliO n=1 Tax=Proluteimonas luteida TaxID=2878685 RepID=UPI001E412B10|nr:flagellar biosynthetic protein FliO [Luteimonas sp. BDR2-5]MCD9029454.1 flagellar biosynthetic protein FliO [Luteimonas sp. BDR2-5]
MTRSARMPRLFPMMLAAAASFSAPLWAATTAPDVVPAPARDSFVGEMIAIVLPLVFIIAGLLLVLRLLRRRYGLVGRDSPLTVLQILPVGPRERVVLVQSRAGRVFAIGVGAQSVTFITDLESDDVAPGPEDPAEPPARSWTNMGGGR